MCNVDVRRIAKEKNVPLWKIADSLGICDMTLTRRLRRELQQADKERIFAIIDKISLLTDGGTQNGIS